MADTDGDIVVVDGFGILNDGTMVVFDGVNWNVKHHFGKEHDDRYEISDYWETESFADGGIVKTKSIITDKIGWSEEVADYLIEQDSKLAIWFADSYMKYWINKYDAKPNLDWVGLSLPQKKQYVSEMFKRRDDFTNYAGENNGGARFEIRRILDWLKHPITPKKNLKEL
jgi:hypothetical protein